MLSILTIEERTLLRSLGCRDKTQAREVLHEIEMAVPVRSELFACTVTLMNKLKHERVDFEAEIDSDDILE